LAISALILAGCDPRFVHESDLNAREVQTLSGVWTGEASLTTPFRAKTYGEDACARFFLWTFRVANGNVDGEVVNKATPKAPPSHFSGFLDYDGSVHAVARLDGHDADVVGSFSRRSFSGQAKSDCGAYVIRLARQGGS